MEWTWLIFGVVLGSLVTSALIWSQRGTGQQALPPGYFSRVALSVVVTALLAGLARLLLDYVQLGQPGMTGAWFSGGWLVGGLVAGWWLSNTPQRS